MLASSFQVLNLIRVILLSVYYFRLMNVRETFDKLEDKILDFKLSQSFPLLQQVIQGIMTAKLEKDIDILSILKNMVKTDNSSMSKRFMDLNLSDELNK